MEDGHGKSKRRKKDKKRKRRTLEDALNEFDPIFKNEYSPEALSLVSKIRKDDNYETHPCSCKDNNETCNYESSCMNIMCLVECDNSCRCEKDCENRKIQKSEWKSLEVRFTGNRKIGMGVFAKQKIEKKSFIIEYVGNVITQTESDERLSGVYASQKHRYILHLTSGLVLDSTEKGSCARFVNHSCEMWRHNYGFQRDCPVWTSSRRRKSRQTRN